MSHPCKILLKPSCILTVQLQNYGDDFFFIVNGEEFKTSRLIADLLSPVICNMHSTDPTINIFTIKTSQSGDFSHILDLFNSQQNLIPESELPFINEVIEILCNESIEYENQNKTTMITKENVFSFIKQHEKFPLLYKNRYLTEIDFISSHFSELCETQEGEKELKSLSIDTLMSIFSNNQLRLKTEDQLLNFLNQLCLNDVKYSILYETVLFEHVSKETMKEFVSIFDIENMNNFIWNRLSRRLVEDISIEKKKSEENDRYIKNVSLGKLFEKSDQSEFNGILNYLMSQSNGQIEKEINITSSSVLCNNDNYQPRNVVLFGDKNKYFYSENYTNSWLCFDFKEHRIIPTDYTIRSYPNGPNNNHPKNWVIECRNDDSEWEIVDEQRNCPHLNGSYLVHTFKINNQNCKKFRYIRMRNIGNNWNGNNNHLRVESFEIYGKLI